MYRIDERVLVGVLAGALGLGLLVGLAVAGVL